MSGLPSTSARSAKWRGRCGGKGRAVGGVLACGLLLAGVHRVGPSPFDALPDRSGNRPGWATRPSAAIRTSVAAFFHGYVDPSGRVVRHDQGGDTVSEGQAYALLLAVAVDNRAEFARVWRWTRTHLQEADGLFAYHWVAGRVVDAMPAADADLQIAWALDLGARRFHDPAYRSAALRVADAVRTLETAPVPGGGTVLTAGPWAGRAPAWLNPSYWAEPATAALARLPGGAAWSGITTTDRRLAAAVTADGRRLPPEWARLRGSTVAPSGPPSRPAAAADFGLNAARLVVWEAVSCHRGDRLLAARWVGLLNRAAAHGALATTLAGRAVDPTRHPLPIVAAAAAAAARGEIVRRDALLTAAARLDARFPTYYGTAWVALGRILLTTTLLGSCG